MASAALCLRTNSGNPAYTAVPYRGIGKYSGCLAFAVSTMLYITAVAQAPASDVWNRKAFRPGLRYEMEENGNGTITRYIRGLGIISSDSEEAKTYYHYVSDEQGSITHILSEDVENRFCYNGEMLDPVTQQDTYYGDGLNLYQYCQANPVGYVDPSGHSVCPVLKSKYEEYRKQHPKANAAEAYEAVTGKNLLKKDNNKSSNKVDFYVTPDGDVIPNGTCVAIGLPEERI